MWAGQQCLARCFGAGVLAEVPGAILSSVRLQRGQSCGWPSEQGLVGGDGLFYGGIQVQPTVHILASF